MTKFANGQRVPAKPTGAASCYENEKGSLVLSMQFNVDGENKLHYFTLASEANGVNTKAIDSLKKLFGWDGQDPFWFVEHPEAYIDKDVEVVIEHVTKTGQNGETVFENIKWVNPVGGGERPMPEMADKRTVLAKYGAQFRALSGGKPSTPVKPAPPKAPTAPAKPPAAPKAPEPTSTQELCWKALVSKRPDADQDKLTSEWFSLLKEVLNTDDQASITPEGWGKMMARISDNIPY